MRVSSRDIYQCCGERKVELSVRHKVSVVFGLLAAEDTMTTSKLAQQVEGSVVSSGDGTSLQHCARQRVQRLSSTRVGEVMVGDNRLTTQVTLRLEVLRILF